jgi:hypothetical protein
MFIDPFTQFLMSIACALLGAGLQMTESKRMGIVLIILSLGWIWWLLVPLMVDTQFVAAQSFALWVGAGWVVICLIGAYWDRQITHALPTTPSGGQISSTSQSGGVTGNYNTVLINQATNAEPGPSEETRREQQETLISYSREGKQLRKRYEVPDDISAVPAKKWAQEVANYLEKNIGPTPAHRFLSDEGIAAIVLLRTDVSRQNKKVHQFITNRLLRLDEIMKKLEG